MTATTTTSVSDAITAAGRVFEETYQRGDAAGMAALYTEDAQFLPPNGDAVKGRSAIQAMFQCFMDAGVKSIKLETLEAEGHGETATEIGTYALATADGQVVDHGKFMVIWKCVAGTWQLHRDMINSSVAVE